VAFYQALDGDNWNNNTNWLQGPVKDWFGVTVERNRVIGIQMVRNGLKGRIPPDINELTALSFLSLQLHDELSGPLPRMDSLQLLRIISLRSSDLRGPFPSVLLKLERLESLDLFECGIIGELPFGLADLQVLNKLILTSNPLGTTFPQVLLTMPWLLDLSLNNCELRGPLPRLSALASLKHLNLSDNQFGGRFPGWLPDLKYLETLTLANCGLTGELPDSLFSRINNGLRIFNIGQNQLEGDVARFMTGYMPMLHYFDIGSNGFWGVIPEGVFNMTILMNFELRKNEISGLPDFSSLQHPVNAFHVAANKIGFEYLERCLGITTVRPNTSSLGPQNKLLEADTISPAPGSSLSIYSGSAGRNSSYQWYFNGDKMTGQVYPSLEFRSITPAQYGVYHCVISNGSFSFDLVRNDITLEQMVGTRNERSVPEVSVFPNPASEVVTVVSGAGVIEQLYIVDLTGRIIRSTSPASEQFQLSLAGLPAGQYYLRVATAKGEGSFRVCHY